MDLKDKGSARLVQTINRPAICYIYSLKAKKRAPRGPSLAVEKLPQKQDLSVKRGKKCEKGGVKSLFSRRATEGSG
jgi:hypothetical protein